MCHVVIVDRYKYKWLRKDLLHIYNEFSLLSYILWTQHSVGREQNNLMHNIAYYHTDYCWKKAKQPDGQHYLLLCRLLLEESKVT